MHFSKLCDKGQLVFLILHFLTLSIKYNLLGFCHSNYFVWNPLNGCRPGLAQRASAQELLLPAL